MTRYRAPIRWSRPLYALALVAAGAAEYRGDAPWWLVATFAVSMAAALWRDGTEGGWV